MCFASACVCFASAVQRGKSCCVYVWEVTECEPNFDVTTRHPVVRQISRNLVQCYYTNVILLLEREMRMLQHSGSRGRPDILLHVYLSCFRSALSTVDPVASLRRYYMFTCHASDQRRSYATLLHERDMCLLPHCRYCGYPDILLHVYLPRVSSAEIACNVTGCQRDTQEIPHSRSRGKSEVLLRVYLTCFSDQRRSRGKIQKIGVL